VNDIEGQKNELLAKICFAQGKHLETLRQLGLVFPEGREPAPKDFEWISNLYLQIGEKEKAVEKLAQIVGSKIPFWQAAAQQQIDYLQLKERGLPVF
jgi:hypothetical protein